MNEQRTITIDLWKAVVILVTAIIASAGAGLWGGIATLNSDHYVLATTVEQVKDLKLGQKEILDRVNSIGSDVSEIKGQIKIK